MKRDSFQQALFLILLGATIVTAADLALAIFRMDAAAPPGREANVSHSWATRAADSQVDWSVAKIRPLPEQPQPQATLAQVHQPSARTAEEELLITESTLTPSARKLQPFVDRHSARFQISRSLIYAIIKAESNFNRLAVSSASAYGLMQVVPQTGGRDAYRMVYGCDEIPTREFLEDPDHNIELGTAYLSLLSREFLAAVDNPVSREYCQIAAYNTGARNVFKAFADDSDLAIVRINSLSPEEVYAHLQKHLPYKETRNYLAKVLDYRREFAML